MTFAPASEALYFDKAPVAHIVAWEERNRLANIARRNREAMASRERAILRPRFGR